MTLSNQAPNHSVSDTHQNSENQKNMWVVAKVPSFTGHTRAQYIFKSGRVAFLVNIIANGVGVVKQA